MIFLPLVITGSGTAEFVFELTEKGQRLTNVVPGTATVSLRKESTSRTMHQLTHLPAHLDDIAGIVTLDLSVDQTTLLVPPIATTDQPVITEVVGDIRIVQGTDVNYFGPFTFMIRLPETFTGQGLPILFLTVVGGLSDDNTPEGTELTIAQIGSTIPLPTYIDKHQLIWRLATEPDLTSVIFASDGTATNQISNYTLWPDMITLSDGREGKVLVSNQLLTDPTTDRLELA